MFTGIIEATTKIANATAQNQSVTIHVIRPPIFDDLKIGDSVAVNGICLTVEKIDSQIQFNLGFETLRVLGLEVDSLLGRTLNLERPLKFGDRVHGHLVSGHADGTLAVYQRENVGSSLILKFKVPHAWLKWIWPKGSVTLNGVSLTVNQVIDDIFDVCLIPETQKKTNLSELQVGQSVVIEFDYLFKGFLNAKKYDEGVSIGGI